MGWRTVTAGFGVDSSPSSAESSFRELDDVFLQTQTRMWLEEVLGTRLDEDLHVSELLQDGELLFEVSKIVWNLLLTKCMELRYLKGKCGLFSSKKNSGRYKPYSNVDSFLKICKILGLGCVDLFSPSDVVEKRDARKVCICIRALSKKARSKQLIVPDFDMVMYSVSMPTDMVGCIRRSLELSQPTLSSSSSYCSPKGSQLKLKQTKLFPPCDRNDDSCSEDSDEAESKYMGENHFPAPRESDCAGVDSVVESSGKVHSAFEQSIRRQNVIVPDLEGPRKDDFEHNFNKSSCLSESVKSFSTQNFENDRPFHKMACDTVSRKKIHRRLRNGAVDISDTKLILENEDSVIGDSSCVNEEESNYIADYLAFSDLMVHGTNASNSVFLDGENHMFDFFLNADSRGLTSEKISFQDDEEMEVSSTTSMSSVLGRVLNLELDNQFEADENIYSAESMEHSLDEQYTGTPIISGTMNSEKFESSACVGLFDPLKVQSRTQSTESFTQSQSVYLLSEMEHGSDERYNDRLITSETKNSETFEPLVCTGLFDPLEAQSRTQSMESYAPTRNICLLSEMEFLKVESSCFGTRKVDVFRIENSGSVETDETSIYKDDNRETASAATFASASNLVQCGTNHLITTDFVYNVPDTALACIYNCESGEESKRCCEQHDNTIVTGVSNQGRVSVDADNHNFVVQENHIVTANDCQGKEGHGVDNVTEKKTGGRLNTSRRFHPGKFIQKPLMKTFFKGTAIAGAFFILLHINKNKEDNALESMQYGQAQSKFSLKNRQTGTRATYPAEKIKLGH